MHGCWCENRVKQLDHEKELLSALNELWHEFFWQTSYTKHILPILYFHFHETITRELIEPHCATSDSQKLLENKLAFHTYSLWSYYCVCSN